MMLVFKEKVVVEGLRGANYNPRVISDEAIKKLMHSINTFGMVKPLIVNRENNTIVAGHQRKEACEQIGITTVPCIFIDSPGKQDEILLTKGLFDICVLEAVINSVVDNDFEKAVLTACNAVTKNDGVLFTCTRNMSIVNSNKNKKKCFGNKARQIYYLDDENYSVSLKNGVVYKQKFHTAESYTTLLSDYFKKVSLIKVSQSYIYCIAESPVALPMGQYEKYLEKEFNIEYPNGYYHNKHKGLLSALLSKVDERGG